MPTSALVIADTSSTSVKLAVDKQSYDTIPQIFESIVSKITVVKERMKYLGKQLDRIIRLVKKLSDKYFIPMVGDSPTFHASVFRVKAHIRNTCNAFPEVGIKCMSS